MTGQAVADNPGLVSHVWFFGSAGITAQTGDELAEQIRSGETTVSATHADDDNIAAWGRKDWLGSLHSEDPRDVPGVQSFGSNGGVVADYGSPQGEYGESTDSHDAHNSTKDELVGWAWVGTARPPRFTSPPNRRVSRPVRRVVQALRGWLARGTRHDRSEPMTQRRWRTLPALVASAVVTATVLTGCGGPQMSPNETPSATPSSTVGFEDAKAANLEYKAAVAEVQKQIFDGDWRVGEYGDVPISARAVPVLPATQAPRRLLVRRQGPQRMEQLRTMDVRERVAGRAGTHLWGGHRQHRDRRGKARREGVASGRGPDPGRRLPRARSMCWSSARRPRASRVTPAHPR